MWRDPEEKSCNVNNTYVSKLAKCTAITLSALQSDFH